MMFTYFTDDYGKEGSWKVGHYTEGGEFILRAAHKTRQDAERNASDLNGYQTIDAAKTLRNHYAGLAMQGMLANGRANDEDYSRDVLRRSAFGIADEMMKGTLCDVTS